MEKTRDAYGNNGTLIPIVCRACGSVQRLSLATVQTRSEVPCAACARAIDLHGIALTLPKVVTVDAPVMQRRAISEFP